jgi:Glyoxalase-like domain
VSTTWGLTIDCARPRELAAFWAVALGYVEPPPPEGFASWEAWLVEHGVPEDEWDDGAYLADPAGTAPTLSFLRVPEPKTVKNRVHVDVKVSGGRSQPADLRRSRIQTVVDRLVAAGAAVQRRDEVNGKLDHVVMTDPEGNEFCVV